jgi:hypothetical protein
MVNIIVGKFSPQGPLGEAVVRESKSVCPKVLVHPTGIEEWLKGFAFRNARLVVKIAR